MNEKDKLTTITGIFRKSWKSFITEYNNWKERINKTLEGIDLKSMNLQYNSLLIPKINRKEKQRLHVKYRSDYNKFVEELLLLTPYKIDSHVSLCDHK